MLSACCKRNPEMSVHSPFSLLIGPITSLLTILWFSYWKINTLVWDFCYLYFFGAAVQYYLWFKAFFMLLAMSNQTAIVCTEFCVFESPSYWKERKPFNTLQGIFQFNLVYSSEWFTEKQGPAPWLQKQQQYDWTLFHNSFKGNNYHCHNWRFIIW